MSTKSISAGFPLLDLPVEMLCVVLERVPSWDRWRAAGSSCQQLAAVVRRHFHVRPQKIILSCNIVLRHDIEISMIVGGRSNNSLKKLEGECDHGDMTDHFVKLPKFLLVDHLTIRWQSDASPEIFEKILRRASEMTLFADIRDQLVPNESPKRPLPLIMELCGAWETTSPSWNAEAITLVASGKLSNIIALTIGSLKVSADRIADCAEAAARWFHRSVRSVNDTSQATKRVSLANVETVGFNEAFVANIIELFEKDDTPRTYYFDARLPKETEPIETMRRLLINPQTNEQLDVCVSGTTVCFSRTPVIEDLW